ncbi:unnamed protein product [Toxocara canis]|uniref:Secreted protein n=1 Tax=Toxocara canis TaxID=6265 RepID=A0A183TXS8_TOXCA|nr:unnamed protein product [Toxocara canis]
MHGSDFMSCLNSARAARTTRTPTIPQVRTLRDPAWQQKYRRRLNGTRCASMQHHTRMRRVLSGVTPFRIPRVVAMRRPG